MASSLQGCDRPPGFSELTFEATAPPAHLECFTDEFEDDNFVKALRFSPCGSLLACSSDDNRLRLFDVPAEAVALGKKAPWPPKRRSRRRKEDESESDSGSDDEGDDDEGDAAAAAATAAAASPPRISLARSWHAGEIVHDLCFHPLGGAAAADQGGGCLGFGPPLLAVAARNHPVHLLGPLLRRESPPPSSRPPSPPPPPIVASFVPLDHAVEPATTTAMCFTPDGATLALGGHAGSVALFDVARPGRTPRLVIPSPKSSPSPSSSRKRGRWKGGARSAAPTASFGNGSSRGDCGDGDDGAGVPLQFGKRRWPTGRSHDAAAASASSSASARAPSAAPLTHCPLRGGSSMVSALACSNAAAAAACAASSGPSPAPLLPPLLAVGFVSGAVSVADPRTGEVLLSLEGGHDDAVTALAWSPCGWYLHSAARRDGAVRCWDVRRWGDSLPPPHEPAGSLNGGGGGGGSGGCALSLSRASRFTQQRIALAVEPVAGRHLLSGGEDGWVRAFDLRAEAEAAEASRSGKSAAAAAAAAAASAAPPPSPPPAPTPAGWRVSREAVAAVAIHPWLPLVAVGSGSRRRSGGGGGSGSESGSDDDDNNGGDGDDNGAALLPRAALSFWKPSYTWRENETARNHE